MPYLIEDDISHPSAISAYEPAIEGRMSAKIALGYELDADERAQLPKRVHVGCAPTQKTTFIYAMMSGPYILPPAAHEILMELGSEGHVFHELEAFADDVSLGSYFLQLQAPVIDCVDIDETVYSNGRGRDYFEEVMARPHGPGGGPPRIYLSGGTRISLLRAAVAGHHWWRVPAEFSRASFCSAELRQRFKEANVVGLKYTQCLFSTKVA